MINDPRWKYIWSEEYQIFYDLLQATNKKEVEWFSNQGSIRVPGLGRKFITMFGGKAIEIDYQVTSLFDPVLDRLLIDLKNSFLSKTPLITELSELDYRDKVKEFKAKQAGLL